MKKIEDVLNWHESVTGIKYRQIEYEGKVIRCLVKTEDNNSYRVIIDAYDKEGNSIATSANSFETVIDADVIFQNLNNVYSKLEVDKPSFVYFMSKSL